MSIWGPGLYDDDTAKYVRKHFCDLIQKGVSDAEATAEIIDEYAREKPDETESAVIWFALADTQRRMGRLLPDVKRSALAAIEEGSNLRYWEMFESPKAAKQRAKILYRLKKRICSSARVSAKLNYLYHRKRRLFKKFAVGAGILCFVLYILTFFNGTPDFLILNRPYDSISIASYDENGNALEKLILEEPASDTVMDLILSNEYARSRIYEGLSYDQSTPESDLILLFLNYQDKGENKQSVFMIESTGYIHIDDGYRFGEYNFFPPNRQKQKELFNALQDIAEDLYNK
jgi:hypothetical protein